MLEVTAKLLLSLDRFEQRLEVALPERLRTLSLDDLVEERRAILDGLGEDLEQITVGVTIDEDAELRELAHRLIDFADAALKLLVVARRHRQELDAAVAEGLHRHEDVIRRQSQVLHTGPAIEVE